MPAALPANGIRAIAKVLLTYQRQHGLDTLAELIERWAPAAENDSFAYIDDVATRLGEMLIQSGP